MFGDYTKFYSSQLTTAPDNWECAELYLKLLDNKGHCFRNRYQATTAPKTKKEYYKILF